MPVSQGIQSPENPIRAGSDMLAGDFAPTLADLIRGINGATVFPLSASQSEL